MWFLKISNQGLAPYMFDDMRITFVEMTIANFQLRSGQGHRVKFRQGEESKL